MSKRIYFSLFLIGIVIFILYNYNTSIDNREITNSESVNIRGTLQRAIYKTEAGRTTLHLNINLREFPNVNFYLDHKYISETDFKYRIQSYGPGDSILILILKQYEHVQQGKTPIYGLELNNKTFLSLKERNDIWNSNHHLLGLIVTITVLLIGAVLSYLGVGMKD